MAPLENVVQVQGDITKKSTVDTVLSKFDNQRANLVVSDGAPDVTGFHDIDQYI
jgi:tRNA (cytidine32/guanosine34-2'-O)-methyltransferase